MTEASVLIVDDEAMVRDVLERYLVDEGFDVRLAHDGEQALVSVADAPPDLILLDLMLPKLDGYETFRRVRASNDTPVIMLTARGEATDRIVGLELGADDYVTKPFSPREVVARVRAVLRRITSEEGATELPLEGTLEFDGLRMDLGRREVWLNGEPVRLTRKEFDLLLHLASSPGVTFTRTQLLEDVWDFAWDGDPSTVTVHIRRLREKIEVEPSDPRRILTVWGVGYRFEP